MRYGLIFFIIYSKLGLSSKIRVIRQDESIYFEEEEYIIPSQKGIIYINSTNIY